MNIGCEVGSLDGAHVSVKPALSISVFVVVGPSCECTIYILLHVLPRRRSMIQDDSRGGLSGPLTCNKPAEKETQLCSYTLL